MNNAPRILVIDDDPDLLAMLEVLLEHEGFHVTRAEGGAEGIARAHDSLPDVILLDVMMPEVDGWTTLATIRQTSRIPIIMLTVASGESDRVKGLNGGADDYVPKPFAREELVARIRKELRRSRQAEDQDQVIIGSLVANLRERRVTLQDHPIHLTPLQWRILEALLRRAGQVVTVPELINAGWPESRTVSPHAVKVQIHHLRTRLGDSARNPHFIRSEWNNGYRFLLEA